MLCRECNVDKPDSDFNFKDKIKGLRSTQCRTCQKAYNRSHYLNNLEQYKARTRKNMKAYKDRLTHKIWEYLYTHPCVDCGEADILVLDFDHLHSKKKNVSHMVHDGANWIKIEKEISKCEVRCANCHRRKTAKQFNWPKLKYVPF